MKHSLLHSGTAFRFLDRQINRRGIVWLVAATICILLPVFFGCQKKRQPSVNQPSVFIFARGADAQKLDPADVDDGESIKVLINIVEGLLQFKDGSTDVEPCLAESWTVSDDGLVYTFKLRKGVKFHDGTPLNATAAAWNFLRQMDPKHPAHLPTATFEYWEAMYKMITSVRALDELTLEIRISEPHAPFLMNLAMFPVAFISPASFEKHGEKIIRNPVGTGPFKFVEWRAGDRIVMAANDDYWNGRPKIDRLIYKVVPDSAARLIQLTAGEIHAMDGIDPINLPFIQRSDKLKLAQEQGINLAYLAMNVDKPPFNDVRVRRAVAMTIRKQDLLDSVYRGTGSRAVNPMPPIVFGFNHDIADYPNDLDAAKKLLAEYRDDGRATMGVTPAGAPPTPVDRPIPLAVMSNPRPYLPNPIRAAELIKGDLERIGLKIQIVPSDWGTHLDITRKGEHELALLGWVSDNGDPDNFLHLLLGSDQAQKGSALNISFYKNPALDQILSAAVKEQDKQKRAALYHKAQEIIHADMPMVPLAHAIDVVAMRRNVEGLRLQPTGDIRFHAVSLGGK